MIKINVYIVIASLAVLVFILPIVLIFAIKKQKTLKITIFCLLCVYLAILGFGVFGNVNVENDHLLVGLKPFGSWFNASSFVYYNFSLVNVCVNLFMFLPVGMACYILLDKSILKTLLVSFLLSLLIEFGQYALPVARTVEITDLVYNTLSGAFGFAYLWFFDWIKRKSLHQKSQNGHK